MVALDLMSLEHMATTMPGLTPSLAGVFAQASAVCLEHNGHRPGVVLKVAGSHPTSFELSWPLTTPQINKSHNDLQEATERGATCIAIHLVNNLLGLSVLERSRKGTGFDYWLGQPNQNTLFQNAKKLEVSGILRGDNGDIQQRLRLKQKQVNRFNGINCCIVVVEFGCPLSHIAA